MNATRPLSLSINGTPVSAQVEPRLLLAEFLRGPMRMTGTHIGCDTTQCGCCTVHLDGLPVKSCTVLAMQCDGRQVTTIEGLGDPEHPHPMQEAFVACHALQCGFCTPGMIMAAVGIAQRDAALDSQTVRTELEGNICRCTGYLHIEQAVIAGARAMRTAATGDDGPVPLTGGPGDPAAEAG